ncbi:MAG: type II secretion system protein N [Armatimonadota bacterium]
MRKLDRKQAQQIAVLGILFLAALGYAGYQLFFAGTTGASTKASSATTQAQPAEQNQQTTTEPEWLTSSEPTRDPFVVPPQFDNLKQQARAQSVRSASSRVVSPPNISALPPMPVMPVSGNVGNGSPPVNNQSDTASQEEAEPKLMVTGVVVGQRPLAILRSEGGDQRIVLPGHRLEGGYVLREVSREGIVIEKDGKTMTLRPGGNPNAK